MTRRIVLGRAMLLTSGLAAAGCGSSGDAEVLYSPWLDPPGPRQPAFLAFSSAYDGSGPAPIETAGFPRRLSETGAFTLTAGLEPASGLVPYDILAPLWSDGALKQRWISVPENEAIGYSEEGRYRLPAGTVFVKHFEMALDERFPERRRRLETRFWIVAGDDAQYGVSYKWNEEQTDARLLVASETETLLVTGADGTPREQPYFYPGPEDCQTCHNAQAGFVLGVRTAQLNRTFEYQRDRPAANQLVAWSSWDLLDRRVDVIAAEQAPRLAALDDESETPEARVRAYWDGNCAMCHAGSEGLVPGWDARYSTPMEEQGLGRAPLDPSAGATLLIRPGDPADSLIYQRGETTEAGRKMPPLGRNRADEAYLDLLERWIASLGSE